MTRKVKAQEIIDTWKSAGSLIEVLSSLGGAGTLSFTVEFLMNSFTNPIFVKDWSFPKKQQLSAVKNSAIQVDIFQNQFNEDSRKDPWKAKISLITNKILKIAFTQDLINHSRKTNIGLMDNDFKILNGITGRKLESHSVKLGLAMIIVYLVNKIQSKN
ncbi:hypothetical protein Glove_529g45 [Diversispora epigaea]|uniref:Uncharacterized protein n=1 Tax=Diversispora epigaea TaxID=1348612 RepID=A0A397GHI0_9GLOM|nr:hypothetical protein Glove_529g45 [Diversispora epigaea]